MSKNICHQCGMQNTVKAKFCNQCGAILNNMPEEKLEFSDKRQFIMAKEALIDKYILLREIGHGGMAVVYHAIQKNLNRPVAIKIIKSNLLNDRESINSFHEEARTAGSLNHPNIITIYDEGEISGIHYIAMEYLEGEDLLKSIRNYGFLDMELFKSYFIQLAGALQYLQSLELVHRDIKSSNIFITTSGRPVLMDFGIASIKNKRLTFEGKSLVGTPEYMSPEQVNGEKVDEKTDLYSLGVVMYECLTGSVPFKGNSYQETLEKIINEIPPKLELFNPQVGAMYEKIVIKLLSKDPLLRFQNGQELIDALESKSFLLRFKHNYLITSIIILLSVIVISSVLLVIPEDNSNINMDKPNQSDQPQFIPENSPVNNSRNDENTGILLQQSPTISEQTMQPNKTINQDSVDSRITANPRGSGSSNSQLFDSYMEKGDALFDKGNYQEAKNYYLKARSIDQDAISPQFKIEEVDIKLSIGRLDTLVK